MITNTTTSINYGIGIGKVISLPTPLAANKIDNIFIGLI
jgi:hypothetical protein